MPNLQLFWLLVFRLFTAGNMNFTGLILVCLGVVFFLYHMDSKTAIPRKRRPDAELPKYMKSLCNCLTKNKRVHAVMKNMSVRNSKRLRKEKHFSFLCIYFFCSVSVHSSEFQWASCLSLLSTGITGMCHHVLLQRQGFWVQRSGTSCWCHTKNQPMYLFLADRCVDSSLISPV